MILRRELPPEHAAWNARHKAPFGPRWWHRLTHTRFHKAVWKRRLAAPPPVIRAIGPFGFQTNSRTRTVEYPWVYHAAQLSPGTRLIDIGAGASGFQFVASREGVEVTSVDPLIDANADADWCFSDAGFARLNKALRCDVTFVRKLLEDARLEEGAYDRVVAVSVIEHIPVESAVSLLREIARVLKPGGLFIATVDLFLDLRPFTDVPANKWGSNVPPRALVDASGLELIHGDRSELFGFDAFDPTRILERARSGEFYTASNVAAQAFVLRKPEANGTRGHG